MKQMHSILLAIAAVAGLSFVSCISDDFTTSSTDVLTFSTDTLSFDTVFTDLGTPTARLKVYNRAKKSLNITSISMAEPNSKFQMNVDGMSGTSFHDIEIRGGDSIFIFVECKLPIADCNAPQLTTDKIQFLTNGVQQSVVLEAWGQNVTRLRNMRITEDTRFLAEQPIVVFDSLIVEPGATLTIDPGAQILFHDKATLTVRGTLNAIGAPGKMIALRGDRLDNVLPDVGYDIMAGQWGGISIAPESFGNRMEYVDMRSTAFGLRVDSTGNTDTQKLLLLNSWLHNSQSTVLDVSHANVSALGCCFSEAADHVVSLNSGIYDFTQCTFSNYYLFSAPYASIIGLYNVLPSEESTSPLIAASFNNCIVYGLAADLNMPDLTNSNVYFRNTLFRSAGNDDANFISCLWDADPLFYTVRNDYIFNYRVKPDSPAIGAGNPAFVTPLCRFDMDGTDRLQQGAPTLGAYQFVPPKED
ncbi:MAG: hypothetical protein NC402_01050 [Prevotella sp.]|nr:hypothetical protein [Prevotella sp.]MCM1075479.1 hypothetical protein [Ruminococcus sp.]